MAFPRAFPPVLLKQLASSLCDREASAAMRTVNLKMAVAFIPHKKKVQAVRDECGYCGSNDRSLKSCTCRLVSYCSVPCQAAHWKAQPGHRRRCIAPADRKPSEFKSQNKKAGRQTRPAQDSISFSAPHCGICQEPLPNEESQAPQVPTQTLVCKHTFHLECASDWESSARSPFCPLCRGPFLSMPVEPDVETLLPESPAVVSPLQENGCLNCGAQAGPDNILTACSRCKTAVYCGQDCQKAHWKDGGHKAVCAPPQKPPVSTTRIMGRVQHSEELWELMLTSAQISNGKAKKLLSRCVDLNEVSSTGDTLLTVAATNGHASIVALLIKAKVALSHKNFQGQTALMLSSFNSHTSIVDLLIKAKTNLDTQDKNGFTALMISACQGHASIVDRLIKAKADLNCQAREETGALGVAAEKGHVEVVRLLLRGGADINLATAGSGATPLYIAAQNGHEELARLLLGDGANLEQGIQSGWSPLFVAAWSGHASVVNLLLEAGANKEVKTTAAHIGVAAGSTPLAIATDKGHIVVVDALRGAASKGDCWKFWTGHGVHFAILLGVFCLRALEMV